MPAAAHDGIHLAEGFHFTDHLDSPYQLVYIRSDLGYSPLYIANIDSSERRILLEADEMTQEWLLFASVPMAQRCTSGTDNTASWM